MKLATRHFGEIEVADETVIQFPHGLIGFPQARAFCVLEDAAFKPYHWLQCVTQPELAFVVVPMVVIKPDYQADLSPVEKALLKLEAGDIPLLLSIVVMAEKADKISANLLAPVWINENSRVGAQLVNDRNGYRSRHYIMEELNQFAREGKNHVGAYTEKEAVLDVG